MESPANRTVHSFQLQDEKTNQEIITFEDGAVRKALRHVAAGGCAGLVEASIMHPLDVIKTRFQLQVGLHDPNGPGYSSMSDCVKKMVRNEGPLSFYKGILPPLLSETPKRATKFFSFETYKSMLLWMDLKDPRWTALAGLGSGMTEGIIIAPFERVKVFLQAQRTKVSVQPSTLSAVRHIVRIDGYGRNGLMKGFTATLARHGVWNAVYFGTYHNLKAWFHSENLQTVHKLSLGLLAGSAATLVNTPFDVAKSRIQGPQPCENPHKYQHLFRTLVVIFKEEGYLALYKGLLPKIMRLGPGGAIMMFVYEQAVQVFQSAGF